MARRKDDMTPEEQAAMKERMLELRQMAHKKIAERTAAKREAEAIVKKARQDREINDVEKAKKVLAEIEEERRVAAEEDAAKAATAETLPPVPPKKPVVESDSSDDDTVYKATMKEKLKAKYKTKYSMKYAQPQQAPPPPPQLPPPANPVTETARDALKNRVSDEVRRMAMASLFGGGGWQ